MQNSSSKKRIILSAGGTGGHLFPAQALASELQDHCEILFVAGGLSTNQYFNKELYSFKEIDTATFSFKNPIKVLKGGVKLTKGFFQAQRIMNSFQPDLVVGFGSFFTLPVLASAWANKIPFFIHEQNAIPGKVNRLFSRCAKTTAITFPLSSKWLKGKTIQVQFPLRKAASTLDRENPWRYFGLNADKKTLLVFGGSQGARKLNELFLETATTLPFPFQVLHFTGKQELSEKARAIYRAFQIDACVKDFEPNMHLAWEIADLAVTRAGAATISELIEAETPAILIPFPFATENHQEKNAEHFVGEVKGGKMLIENKTTKEALGDSLEQLFIHELKSKKENIHAYKKDRHLKRLADIIIEDIA